MVNNELFNKNKFMLANENFQKIKEHSAKVSGEVKDKTLSFIITAFSLVAGLAWNEAIQALIKHFFTIDKDSVWAKFIYAVVMTLILVVITIYLTKFFKRKDQ